MGWRMGMGVWIVCLDDRVIPLVQWQIIPLLSWRSPIGRSGTFHPISHCKSPLLLSHQVDWLRIVSI
jgi:hypothetical protein